ncbi:hypothetical protein LJK88_32225 [Paenibacillus sp. P26]|nr:hypothetical protein LJK88_32225 [Paenibacillus sp. P26]
MKTKETQAEASIRLKHSSMDVQIGLPALLHPGGAYPEIEITAAAEGTGTVQVIRLGDGGTATAVPAVPLIANEKTVIRSPGTAGAFGDYRIDVEIETAGRGRDIEHFYFTVAGEPKPYASKAAFLGDEGGMTYAPDYRGNRSPDYSCAGYRGGGIAIPEVSVRVAIEPIPGDNTLHIQEAIDRLSLLPEDDSGFRGALLLRRGVYEVAGPLQIASSGIVLRGEGQGDYKHFWYDPDSGWTLEELKAALAGREATVLIATGGVRRRLLRAQGLEGGVRVKRPDTESRILDRYVPVGANSFRVERPEAFRVGDSIIVKRIGNAEWISEIGMDRIPPRGDGGAITQWAPFDLEFEHVITAIEGDRITIDSSLVQAIEREWGGGTVVKFDDPGRIGGIGIENLRAIAYWRPNTDGVDDTRHADQFLELDHLKNAWVKQVTAEHFTGTNGAFRTGRGSKWITIQDSSTLVPPKKFYNGNGYDPTGRTFYETNVYVGRYGFCLNGQSALVQRCYALNNRHGFTLGSRVTGPNVFLDCTGDERLTWSEPHHRWSVGGSMITCKTIFRS